MDVCRKVGTFPFFANPISADGVSKFSACTDGVVLAINPIPGSNQTFADFRARALQAQLPGGEPPPNVSNLIGVEIGVSIAVVVVLCIVAFLLARWMHSRLRRIRQQPKDALTQKEKAPESDSETNNPDSNV